MRRLPGEDEMDLHEEVVKAVEDGDKNTIQRWLDGGVDVNEKYDFMGNALLHIAAEIGQVGVVTQLLDYKADVFAQDMYGRTPLHRAAEGGHVQVCKLLIDNDYTVIYALNKDGEAPLYTAAVGGHVQVCELLIDNGAYVDAAGKYGHTPLHEATVRGHIQVCELLIDVGGADLDAADEDGNTPLHAASEKGNVAVVKLLLQHGASVERTNVYDNTPFDMAQNEEIRNLLEDLTGTPLLEESDEGRTPDELLELRLDEEILMQTNNTQKRTLDDANEETTKKRKTSASNDSQTSHIQVLTEASDQQQQELKEEIFYRKAKCLDFKEDDLEFDRREDFLAQGGFSHVYKARCKPLGNKTVVVKIIDQIRFNDVDKRRIQASDEARAMCSLTHENIIRIHGLWFNEDDLGLVLEFMQHSCLSKLVKNYRVPPGLQVRMMLGIAQALHYLHTDYKIKPTLIHCDVKLDNIFVDDMFTAKLGDFGVARFQERNTTLTTTVRGTRTHIAPELWKPALAGRPYRKNTCETDVWSYGVTLYELLKRKTPLSDLDSDVKRVQIIEGIKDMCRDELKNYEPKVLVSTALDCIERLPTDRPDFERIVQNLQEEYEKEFKARQFEDMWSFLKVINNDSSIYHGDYPKEGKGLVVIINNIEFEDPEKKVKNKRNGSEKDESNLCSVFKDILSGNYDVLTYRDCTLDTLREKFDIIKEELNTKTYCQFIFFILSHGRKEGVITCEGKHIAPAEIVSHFAGPGLKSIMSGMPKAFFFQACRGTQRHSAEESDGLSETDESDASLEEYVLEPLDPVESDVVAAFATTKGCKSWRDKTRGSWFIENLCDVIKESYQSTHLLDMLVDVHQRVSKKEETYRGSKATQLPTYNTTFKKKMFLLKNVHSGVQGPHLLNKNADTMHVRMPIITGSIPMGYTVL